MGRPVQKTTKEMLEFIIENPYKLSFSAIARKFSVHHTTILHNIKKLRKAGFIIPKYFKGGPQSEVDQLIEQIKTGKKYE